MKSFYRMGYNKKLGDLVTVCELYLGGTLLDSCSAMGQQLLSALHAESGGIDLLSSPHCGGTRGACKNEAP